MQRLDISHNPEFCNKYWKWYFLWLQRPYLSQNPEFRNKYWRLGFL